MNRQELKDRYYGDVDFISSHSDAARQSANEAHGYMLEFRCPLANLKLTEKHLLAALDRTRSLMAAHKTLCETEVAANIDDVRDTKE